MVSFTPFFKLNDLAFTKVDGVFNSDWQGDYHRVVSGDSSWSEPTLGSGVVVEMQSLDTGLALGH